MAVSSARIVNPDRTFEGILWMVATGLCFTAVTGIVRYLGSGLPAVEAAFIRYVIGLLMLGPIMLKIFKVRIPLKIVGGFAVRGLVHGLAVILWFYAMARIPIAEVTAIGYTSPLFVTIGAALFLDEKLKARRIAGVALGMLGAVIILRPGFQEISIGQLAQLTAAPMFAVSFIMAKKLTQHASPDVIVAMLSVVCSLVLLPGAVMQWQTPTLAEIGWLAATAFFATLGHYTLTRALQAAPISVTQPISFLQLVWATILGIVAFGEAIDPFVILGGGVIVAAASYISHREAQEAKREITLPSPATRL